MTGKPSSPAKSRRGIVLTLDIAIAMMVLLAVVAMAYASYGSSSRDCSSRCDDLPIRV